MEEFDPSKVRKFIIDIKNGIYQADGAEDHQRMMEALAVVGKFHTNNNSNNSQQEEPQQKNSLTIGELLDKFLMLKKPKTATVIYYKIAVGDFEKSYKLKCYITDIKESDIVLYQEFLAEKKNTPRTIDSKVGVVKAIINFAIKQGYLKSANPANGKNLLTKKQKSADGYDIFEKDEVVKIFTNSNFKYQKEKDPDYFWCCVLALITGCRASEITTLTKEQFQLTDNKNNYIVIRDGKTNASKREIPIPVCFMEDFKSFYDSKTENLFKYAEVEREGKGNGNAVGKKFARQLQLLKITRGKLVFHSLRKFLNDYLMKAEVQMEPRCQMFGHEIEDVNVMVYANKYNADQLHKLVNRFQEEFYKLVK